MAEERKLVTIVFADVTGSTALGESVDPEDMRALMGRYYEHARRIVADYGGTLEKFIGDAVMAVFGLPQAHSNDAERALAAAQALLDAVAEHARARLLDPLHRSLLIADALTANDNVRLAAAVDDAEAHGLIPHAARMRIVLAQRTGDRAQLDRARPVLERLGDRQFLRRLDEVAASLH